MPKRQPPLPALPARPTLTVSRDEARRQIVARAEIGRRLAASEINSAEALEAIRAERMKRDAYTQELLRRLFIDDQLAKEFRRSAFSGVSHIDPTIPMQVRSLRQGISW
jgi:hypothetical protein